jgi:hypothetical protein
MVTSKINCPVCGHAETAKAESAVTLADIGVFKCDACSSRVIYGQVLPRVVHEPYVDRRGVLWLRTRYQDPKTKADLYVVDLDPQYAAGCATNVLSITVQP